MNPMMLTKFMIKNSTQDQPENNHKMILHLIYTLKRVLKCFKIEIRDKNIHYVQTNQEMNSNIFMKFLVIFLKSETIFKIKGNRQNKPKMKKNSKVKNKK